MLHERWRLSATVALRPEPFGALAYDFTTRQLSFLKTPALVSVVRALDASADVEAALIAAEVPAAQWHQYLAALRRLAGSGMLTREGVAA